MRDESARSGGSLRVVVVVAVLIVFAIILGFKIAGQAEPSGTGAAPESGDVAKLSEVRGNAAVVYDEAIASGKPVYVLFHSLTCEPCIEISTVVDEVVPAYAGKVTFVNGVTDDPGAQQLASRFAFQYIPTSFFVTADGEIMDSFTGVLSAAEMRGRLDALVAK